MEASGEKQADAKSILTVLTLGATKGSEVVLKADGPDEAEAVEKLAEFLTSHND